MFGSANGSRARGGSAYFVFLDSLIPALDKGRIIPDLFLGEGFIRLCRFPHDPGKCVQTNGRVRGLGCGETRA